jgi:hypothetical protein
MKKVNDKETRIRELEVLYEKMVRENEDYANEVKSLK